MRCTSSSTLSCSRPLTLSSSSAYVFRSTNSETRSELSLTFTSSCVFSVYPLSRTPHTSFHPSFHSNWLCYHRYECPPFPVSFPVVHIIATSSLDHHPFQRSTCVPLVHVFFLPRAVGVSYIFLFLAFSFLFLSAPVTPSPGLAMFGQSSLPHQLPFIFQLFPAPTTILFVSFLHLSFLSIRIGFIFFYSSLIFFAIVLCIPLFTFLSLVRIMD